MADRSTLVVVYDRGSLSPTRLAEVAACNEAELLFVVGAEAATGTPIPAAAAHAEEMMPALRMCGEVVTGVPGRLDELLTAIDAHQPAGIVTFSEFQLAPTARLAARLGLPHHALDDIPAITLKDAQRQRFAERGVDALRAEVVTAPGQLEAALEKVGLPAVVKPVWGASSRNTRAVHTAAEAHAFVAGLLAGTGPGVPESALIIEELLVGRPTPAPWGDYMAVDCAVRQGRAEALFTSSKFTLAEPFRERGAYGTRSVVEPALVAEVEALACRAVEALGVTTGIADVEIKLTPDGPRVIEVNGRLGAWVDDLAVRSESAVPAEVAVRAALGLPFDGRREAVPDNPIAFHYLLVPPVGVTEVRAIHGVPALRRVPNADRVTVLTSPGSPAGWELGATVNAAAVSGTVATHDELAETVAALEEVPWITYG
ncbi:ATP-grasp domain-containing protein [Micromonospora sp. DT231]|uniref:ATP-grasp domain-containing protein n=1 Tax=Micromonospora sp. DT231 TaxID=3416526 RepID=UPI003CF33087